MELLASISRVIGLSGMAVFIINWMLTGGYFNFRIHKYDRKINIATKLLESKIISNKAVEKYCEDVIDGALFGIEYYYDCSGEQLTTLRNMVSNGRSKRSVKISAKLIDQAGKLKHYNWLEYAMFIIYFFGMIVYALIVLWMLIKILGSFIFVSYKIEFISMTAGQDISSLIVYLFLYFAIFIFFCPSV